MLKCKPSHMNYTTKPLYGEYIASCEEVIKGIYILHSYAGVITLHVV